MRWMWMVLLGFSVSTLTVTGAAQESGSTGEVKRDPKGVTGISPVAEAVRKGDVAAIAGSYPEAETAYQEAIRVAPESAVGYLRLGQLKLLQGENDAALNALRDALKRTTGDPPRRSQALFLIATALERKRELAEGTDAWDEYRRLHLEQPKLAGHIDVAEERAKRARAWMRMLEQYTTVKERIEKRLMEADERARKDARQ